jgi:hypothetical protein
MERAARRLARRERRIPRADGIDEKSLARARGSRYATRVAELDERDAERASVPDWACGRFDRVVVRWAS